MRTGTPQPRFSSSGGPLFGREVEVAMLDQLVARIPEQGGALVLRGDPGIGKTALLAAASAAASSKDVWVLRTAGAQSETGLAFAGLHQLVRPVLARLDRLPGPQRDALSAAFGTLDVAAPGPVPDRACGAGPAARRLGVRACRSGHGRPGRAALRRRVAERSEVSPVRPWAAAARLRGLAPPPPARQRITPAAAGCATGVRRTGMRSLGRTRASGTACRWEQSRGRVPAARDQLSTQELQIAQMAARGMTNRKIGQQLYLSPRTVGSHLYRLFPKLGVTSRNQLAGALDVAGEAPAT